MGAVFMSGISSVAAASSVSASWGPDIITGVNDLDAVIQGLLNLLLFLVVIAAVIYITMAGFKYISSQGDPGKAKEAQAAITNAIIGLVVAFAAYFIVTFVITRIGADPNQFQDVDQSNGSGSIVRMVA